MSRESGSILELCESCLSVAPLWRDIQRQYIGNQMAKVREGISTNPSREVLMCRKKYDNWYYGPRNRISFDREISPSYLFYNIATIINYNAKNTCFSNRTRKNIKLAQTQKLHPLWIVFIELKDAMQTRKLINKYTQLWTLWTIKCTGLVSYVHLCNSDMNIMGVTSHFLTVV